jgi:hypothetical protein
MPVDIFFQFFPKIEHYSVVNYKIYGRSRSKHSLTFRDASDRNNPDLTCSTMDLGLQKSTNFMNRA